MLKFSSLLLRLKSFISKNISFACFFFPFFNPFNFLPTIIPAKLLFVCFLGLQWVMTSPCLKIVARSQSSIISSSLWLIYKILHPSSRNFFKKLKRERISKGFNTEVGSSIMSSFGFCINERTISIRCFSLTDKSKTLLLGSSGNPYLWETSKIVFSSCLVGF